VVNRGPTSRECYGLSASQLFSSDVAQYVVSSSKCRQREHIGGLDILYECRTLHRVMGFAITYRGDLGTGEGIAM
jgi:hypothetical protein